jgi:hypothetical protein
MGLIFVKPEDAAFPEGTRFRRGSRNYEVRRQVNRLKLEVVR